MTSNELFNHAMQLEQNGDYVQAASIYEKMLQENPQHPLAPHRLGNIAYKENRLSDAEAYFRQAVENDPQRPDFWTNLAGVCFKQNKLQVAESAIQKALEINPQYAEAYNTLAGILLLMRQVPESIDAFENAISLRPDYLEPMRNLSKIYEQQERPADALRIYEMLLQYEPQNSNAKMRLGSLQLELKLWDMALITFQELVKEHEDSAFIHSQLSIALRECSYHDEALKHLKRAAELRPDNLQLIFNLGVQFYEWGLLDDAVAQYEKGLEKEPQALRGWLGLAHAKRYSDPEEGRRMIEKLQALSKQEGLESEQIYGIHCALGKIYDDLGEWKEAFTHYKIGNDAVVSTFDREQLANKTQKIRSVFTKDFILEKQQWGSKSEQPIFLVGMPRSGTSLTETILGSHPKILPLGERKFFGRLSNQLPGLLHVQGQYPEVAKELTEKAVRDLSRQYVEEGLEKDPDAEKIVDKMPSNFMHLGLIAILFPNAKIIHCRRDPMDVCVSNYFQRFGDGLSFTSKLSDLGFYYRNYQEMMEHWKQVLPVEIYESDYESLVTNLEEESRKLVDFVGMEWDPKCLEFYETKRIMRTASAWQVRQPIYTRSVGRWKHYEEHLDPFLRELEKK